jgi:protein involved in polysaccharide export with SLBB domain
VILPDLPPIPAAGRRFSEFRADLEGRVQTSMIGTQPFVSLGSVRMVRVTVAGEVPNPGAHHLTGLSTVMDALYEAGGVRKTGSLRRIRVNRGGQGFGVDFYDLLLKGQMEQDLTLMDGDQIVVPPIGPTAAVAGDVTRQAIFELVPGDPPTALDALIRWAGRTIRPGGNRFLLLSLDARGRDQVGERRDLAGAVVRDGDILLVQEGTAKYSGSVFLAGHVRTPGLRSLGAAPSVRRLVGDLSAVKENPYLLFAVLSRVDRKTGARRLIPVDLASVLLGRGDVALEDDDVFVVLSEDDLRYLGTRVVQDVLAGRPMPSALVQEDPATRQGGLVEALVETEAAPPQPRRRARTRCAGLVELSGLVATDPGVRFASARRGLAQDLGPEAGVRVECPEVYDLYPEVLAFVLEHAVVVSGEVRLPGVYPVGPGATLAGVIAYAGGMTREADTGSIEVSRFPLDSGGGRATVSRDLVNLRQRSADQLKLEPGDAVRVNPVFTDRDTGPVVLSGEFVRPGVYDISRGERLSQVIARAGGLTAQAYPYGAVFTRERVKRQERENHTRYVRELQSSLALVAARGESTEESRVAIAAVQNLVAMLKETEPVGRVVLEADPTVLQVRPELDTILEPRDRVHMPKRPGFVTVTGEVLNPGAVAFQPGLKASGYVTKAGGMTRAADDDRVFLILPDGSAEPGKMSAWNYTPQQIPPGSTIVVPRDPLPFDWMVFGKSIAGLVADLAVTAAALSSINN